MPANFCKRLFISTALAFLFFSSFAQMEIGLQLYSFRNQIPKDVSGMLQKIHRMGIRYVESAGTYNLSDEEFKTRLEKNGLQMIGYSADFKDLQEHPEEIAKRARFFGAKYVVCFWVPHNGDVFTPKDAQKAVEVFNKAGKQLKENGLAFAYHAHGYEFQTYNNSTFFDYFLQHLDPAYANIEMDVFWFKNSGQDPIAWLTKYPNRFPLLHLKDRKIGSPDNVTAKADVESNVVLGTGDVNIAAVMKAAKAAGVRYAFIEDESSRSEEQVPQSLAYLGKIK